MANRYWVSGGTGNWSSTTNWSTSSGGARGASVPSINDTAIFNASSSSGIATLDSSVTIQELTITGFTGTLAFGTNTISLNGTGTIFTAGSFYNVTGTPLILCTNASASSRTINAGTTTEATCISFQFTAGSGAVTISSGSTIRSLIFSGTFTGSLSNSAFVLVGDLTFKAGMTITAGTGIKTFAASSGTQSITSAALNLNFPITFLNSFVTYRLKDALAVGTTTARTITLQAGTLDLNNFTLTHFGNFSSNFSGARSIAFGTGSYVNTRSGSATYWDFPNTEFFSYTGTPNVIFSPSSGTCTILHGTSGGGSESKALNFTFGNVGATIAFSNSYILDLTLLGGGSNHTYTNTTPTIYGSYSQNASTNFTSLTLASTNTSRINTINPANFSSLPSTMNINGGVGTVYKLLNSSTSLLVAWNVFSSLDTNGRNLSGNSFNFNNSNTKTITISSGNYIEINNNFGGSGAFIGSMVGTTLNVAGSSVRFGSSGWFNVPNGTFPELNVEVPIFSNTTNTVLVGSVGNTQTIETIKEASGIPNRLGKIVLIEESTLNVVDMFYTNNGGITNPLNTIFPNIQATLRKTSGTLIVNQRNIRDIVATGGAVFRAPTVAPYNNINGGNNVGWDFGALPVDGTANVTGVQATGAVGTATATGEANTDLTGVESTGQVGVTTANGDGQTNLTGVESTGEVGTTTASGAANADLIGAQTTGSVGTVIASGAGNVNLTGVEATGEVGTVTASGGGAQAGNAYPTGVQAIASVGTVTADGGNVAPVLPNGGLGYPFIIEPDRIIPPRHAAAGVKSASAIGKVGKALALGTIVINAEVSVQAILHQIKINSMMAKGIQNPTDEELIALFFMD